MKELVRLRMRPSRDRKSFRYMLDYVDQSGRRRQVSLGHADKRQAERQRHEKEIVLVQRELDKYYRRPSGLIAGLTLA